MSLFSFVCFFNLTILTLNTSEISESHCEQNPWNLHDSLVLSFSLLHIHRHTPTRTHRHTNTESVTITLFSLWPYEPSRSSWAIVWLMCLCTCHHSYIYVWVCVYIKPCVKRVNTFSKNTNIQIYCPCKWFILMICALFSAWKVNIFTQNQYSHTWL